MMTAFHALLVWLIMLELFVWWLMSLGTLEDSE